MARSGHPKPDGVMRPAQLRERDRDDDSTGGSLDQNHALRPGALLPSRKRLLRGENR